MLEQSYRTFSLKAHRSNARIMQPNSCQFELTFRCGLHCRHCYTDCFNKPRDIKKEMKTKEVMRVLENVRDAGVIWLCLTGGDPLSHPDFISIYRYAKSLGFLITVFTNLSSIADTVIRCFKTMPLFSLEVTLNSANEQTYDAVAQVPGAFKRSMANLAKLKAARLPLKIKTLVTSDTVHELQATKKFITSHGFAFNPSYWLHARLNGDTWPCALRIPLNDIRRILLPQKNRQRETCNSVVSVGKDSGRNIPHKRERLFRCAIGRGDGFQIDPYGRMIPCTLIRRPAVDVRTHDITSACATVWGGVRNRVFKSSSRCSRCAHNTLCPWCPGKAYLESKNMEKPIAYFCDMMEDMHGL